MDCQITWYGRCCFLVEIEKKRILFDPYDRFCNVDIGMIDANILLSSSTWHDHGHIGAAPGSWVYTYPGAYIHDGVKITGIETVEERGTPTVVFNISYKGFSFTNFADMGNYDKEQFCEESREILGSTNVAFIRSGHEKVLEFCTPALLFPEHYLPMSFIKDQIPLDKHHKFIPQVLQTEKMFAVLGRDVVKMDNYEYTLVSSDLSEQKIVQLLKIHPQVTYVRESQTKRWW